MDRHDWMLITAAVLGLAALFLRRLSSDESRVGKFLHSTTGALLMAAFSAAVGGAVPALQVGAPIRDVIMGAIAGATAAVLGSTSSAPKASAAPPSAGPPAALGVLLVLLLAAAARAEPTATASLSGAGRSVAPVGEQPKSTDTVVGVVFSPPPSQTTATATTTATLLAQADPALPPTAAPAVVLPSPVVMPVPTPLPDGAKPVPLPSFSDVAACTIAAQPGVIGQCVTQPKAVPPLDSRSFWMSFGVAAGSTTLSVVLTLLQHYLPPEPLK